MVAVDFAHSINAQISGNSSAEFDHFSFDSRRMYAAERTCFLVLTTDHGSGHAYISTAIAKGATCILTDRLPEGIDIPNEVAVLLHENPMAALWNWAGQKRRKFSGPVLAITGSNGKTITKEWAYVLLHQNPHVYRTPGSFNSQLGVALTLSEMPEEQSAAIIEVGIDAPGTMADMAGLVQPTFGVFTTLGDAHGDAFESEDEKFAEKWKLFAGCEKIACEVKWYEKAKGMNLPCPPALLWGAGAELDPVAWNVPFESGPNLENAMSAIAAAVLLGASKKDIEGRLAELSPLDMRMQLLRAKGGGYLLEDTYSSDLRSLRYALEELKTQSPTAKKWAVLSVLGDAQATSEAKALVEAADLDQCWWVKSTDDVAELAEAFSNLSLRDTTVLVKGRRSFRLERLAATLREQYHSTWVDVDLDAMRNNLKKFKSLLFPHTKVMAMVKAASYGAGTLEVARWLESLHIDYLGVAFAQEALNLRAHGITSNIMVMNAEPHQIPLLAAADCEVELYQLEQLQPWLEHPSDKVLKLHLKIDTGMHRLGFYPEEIPMVISYLQSLPNTTVVGAFTHLSATDNPEHDAFTESQFARFDGALKLLREAYPGLQAHALNTHGIERFRDRQYQMVRLGLGLYGVGEYRGVGKLDPVLSWTCRISQVGELSAGESVGYSRAFVADKPMRYATLPVGYADGLSRSLSGGKGIVCIEGKPCRILGNVCMDMVMVDVTDVPQAKAMDPVVIIGKEYPVERLAEAMGTIAYEVLTGIGPRVPRLYHKG